MDCFEKIKSAFDKAENIVLIPHTNADGDATGSCFALAMFLEKFGKKVDVVFEEFPRLTKIIPYDYKRMLESIAKMEEKGLNAEQAQIEAFYAVRAAK